MDDVTVRPGEWVLAVLTVDRRRVGGGAPIFYADDEEELQHMALLFSRFCKASAHEVAPGTLLILRH